MKTSTRSAEAQAARLAAARKAAQALLGARK